MAFEYVASSIAAIAAMVAAGTAVVALFRVQTLKVSVDGSMTKLIAATQALGREEGRAIEKAATAEADIADHKTNGHHLP